MGLIASQHQEPRLGRVRGLAVVLTMACLVASCSAAGLSPSMSPAESASPFGISPSNEPSAPTRSPAAPSFTTPGATSDWTGFAWSQLSSDSRLVTADPGVRLLSWRGGFVAYGTTNGGSDAFVWTSADGQTWTQVTAITAPQVLVAVAPAGLVAVAGDPSAAVPSEIVWTSFDGVAWRNFGSPSGLAFVDSIAGTSVGLVATGHTLDGTGKFATGAYFVAFSTDGINWTPVSIQGGITWDDVGPQVQSGDNRFFVMGGYTGGLSNGPAFQLDAFAETGRLSSRELVGSGASGVGGLWWSDDGRTWTSTGDWVYATALVFGRDGILAQTSGREIPGGTGLDLSTDGGKTWKGDNNFEPLGVTVCGQGECSAGPDGVIASNGKVFLAVKSNGKAWVSYDGKTWTVVAWNASSPGYPILVLPRGVVVGNTYGAAT